jgi:hypothetical protein
LISWSFLCKLIKKTNFQNEFIQHLHFISEDDTNKFRTKRISNKYQVEQLGLTKKKKKF